jgi:hypothetical protein
MVCLFLLWLSPIILVYWLILFTLFLKYLNLLTWNSFVRTWLPIFTLWYLILIVDLGKYSPIIIGPGYTEELLGKVFYNGLYFERICLSTILTLHMVSSFLGFPIIIPVIFNIFKRISYTDCQGDDKPKPSKPTDSIRSRGWFGGLGGGTKNKTQNQKDTKICSKLADEMAKTEYRNPLYQYKTMDSEDGKRTSHNLSVRVPGFGLGPINICATTNKKDMNKDNKKD